MFAFRCFFCDISSSSTCDRSQRGIGRGRGTCQEALLDEESMENLYLFIWTCILHESAHKHSFTRYLLSLPHSVTCQQVSYATYCRELSSAGGLDMVIPTGPFNSCDSVKYSVSHQHACHQPLIFLIAVIHPSRDVEADPLPVGFCTRDILSPLPEAPWSWI